MEFRIRWASLVAVGGLALLGAAAMAQDGPNISITVGQHAVGTLPGGQTAGNEGGGAGPGAAPAGAPGATSVTMPGPGGDSTAVTETTTPGAPGAKKMPGTGGDPGTLSALGMGLLGLGYGVRRRFRRR